MRFKHCVEALKHNVAMSMFEWKAGKPSNNSPITKHRMVAQCIAKTSGNNLGREACLGEPLKRKENVGTHTRWMILVDLSTNQTGLCQKGRITCNLNRFKLTDSHVAH